MVCCKRGLLQGGVYRIVFLNLYSAALGRDDSVALPVRRPREYRNRLWDGKGILKEIQTARSSEERKGGHLKRGREGTIKSKLSILKCDLIESGDDYLVLNLHMTSVNVLCYIHLIGAAGLMYTIGIFIVISDHLWKLSTAWIIRLHLTLVLCYMHQQTIIFYYILFYT